MKTQTKRLAAALLRALRCGWSALRTATGDDAYERYRRYHLARHPGVPLLSRGAFCAQAEQRKWSGVSRCC